MGKTRRVEELGYATKTTKAAQVTHCSHLHENSADCRIKRGAVQIIIMGVKGGCTIILSQKLKSRIQKKLILEFPKLYFFSDFSALLKASSFSIVMRLARQSGWVYSTLYGKLVFFKLYIQVSSSNIMLRAISK